MMKSEHLKIYYAKILLLKEPEINKKTFKFPLLREKFNLPKEILIDFLKEGFISLNLCQLLIDYTVAFGRKKKSYQTTQEAKRLASISGGSYYQGKPQSSYLDEKNCGLPEEIYQKLYKDGYAEVNILDFQETIKNEVTPLDFISFSIKIDTAKVKKFLDEKIDLFIKNELPLTNIEDDINSANKAKGFPANSAIDKSKNFLSYERQKEGFAMAIKYQIDLGLPSNKFNIDFTKIWNKKDILQTNLLETALAMEKEGLIEIRDITDTMPRWAGFINLDLVSKHPTKIEIKVLPDFYKYHAAVYKKYNPAGSVKVIQEKKEDAPKEERKSSNKHTAGGIISEIICVKPGSNSNRIKVVVNGNYENSINADMTKPSWDLLFKVADEKRFFCESRGQCKNSVGYFNNNKNNKIYTQTSCKLTKVLKFEGEYVVAEEYVTIKTISEKSFKTRLNKT